jgi:hypothetical protein
VIGAPGQDQLRTVMPELRLDYLQQYGYERIIRPCNGALRVPYINSLFRDRRVRYSIDQEKVVPHIGLRGRYSTRGFLFKAGYAPAIYLQPYPQPEWSCYYPLSNFDTAAKDFRYARHAWASGQSCLSPTCA